MKANEAITLKLIFKGSGNLKYMKNPDLKLPNDFDTYDPKVDVSVKATTGGVSGTRTVEYTTIPRFAGKFRKRQAEFIAQISPYGFEYFVVKMFFVMIFQIFPCNFQSLQRDLIGLFVFHQSDIGIRFCLFAIYKYKNTKSQCR